MNNIRFIHDWNGKLGNDVFTTIRAYNEPKFRFYSSQIGQRFVIEMNNDPYGYATLVDLDMQLFKDIDPFLLRIDTGLTDMDRVRETFRGFNIYDDTSCLILLFKKE
jgi:hypothetical protein